jgi:hypothetical protein
LLSATATNGNRKSTGSNSGCALHSAVELFLNGD